MSQNSSNFIAEGVLYGTASTSGSSASGTYTDLAFVHGLYKGSYAGSVAAQKSLNVTLTDPSNSVFMSTNPGNQALNMSYDSIYTQPASLSAIAGNYLGVGFNTNGSQQLIVSGSSLTLTDMQCPAPMSGTIAPHGDAVNVFDVSLTKSCTHFGGSMIVNNIPAGTKYKGILFRTSGGLSSYTELVAVSEGQLDAVFFMGSK